MTKSARFKTRRRSSTLALQRAGRLGRRFVWMQSSMENLCIFLILDKVINRTETYSTKITLSKKKKKLENELLCLDLVLDELVSLVKPTR
jgi:hypothetical protein